MNINSVTHAVTSGAVPGNIRLEDFSKIAFCIGTITSAEPTKGLRVSAYKVAASFGTALGSLVTVAQLPYNYKNPTDLIGRPIVCVTNLGPKRMGSYQSQFLVVGFPDEQDHVCLLNTRGIFPVPGTTLSGVFSKENISYEAFSGADIRVGTVSQVRPAEEVSTFLVDIDLGSVLGSRTVALNNPEGDPTYLVGQQVPVLTNLDSGSVVLSITTETGQVRPLGVDGKVPNGGKLF